MISEREIGDNDLVQKIFDCRTEGDVDDLKLVTTNTIDWAVLVALKIALIRIIELEVDVSMPDSERKEDE